MFFRPAPLHGSSSFTNTYSVNWSHDNGYTCWWFKANNERKRRSTRTRERRVDTVRPPPRSFVLVDKSWPWRYASPSACLRVPESTLPVLQRPRLAVLLVLELHTPNYRALYLLGRRVVATPNCSCICQFVKVDSCFQIPEMRPLSSCSFCGPFSCPGQPLELHPEACGKCSTLHEGEVQQCVI